MHIPLGELTALPQTF